MKQAILQKAETFYYGDTDNKKIYATEPRVKGNTHDVLVYITSESKFSWSGHCTYGMCSNTMLFDTLEAGIKCAIEADNVVLEFDTRQEYYEWANKEA